MPKGKPNPLRAGEAPRQKRRNEGKRWQMSETKVLIESRIPYEIAHKVIAKKLERTERSCRIQLHHVLGQVLSGRRDTVDQETLKLIDGLPEADKARIRARVAEENEKKRKENEKKRSKASIQRKFKVEKRGRPASTRQSPVNSSKWSAKDHEAGALLMGLANTPAMLRPPPSLSISPSATVQRPASSQSVSPLTTVPRPAMSGSISPRTTATNPLTFGAGSTWGNFRMADQYPVANAAPMTLALRQANPAAQTQYVAPVVSQTPAATPAASTPQSFKSAGGVELLNRDDSPSAPGFTPVNGN